MVDTPQIPKIEDVSEALSVLERVALHNRLDAVAEATALQFQDRKQQPLPGRVSPYYVNNHRHAVHRPRAPAASPFASSSVTRTTTSFANSSAASVADEQHLTIKEQSTNHRIDGVLMPNAPPAITSFTVKVMDFPPSSEAEGDRKTMSWHQNQSLAGYCPPEMATSAMWQDIQQRREEERERGYDRDRRLAVGRGTSSNGHRSPRPDTRRRSINGAAMNSPDHHPHHPHPPHHPNHHHHHHHRRRSPPRSSSGTNRRQFDSETYALFGDDHLVDLPEADDASYAFIAEPASPPDRSGRHAVARGPGTFRDYQHAREDVLTQYAGVADRLYQSQQEYTSEERRKEKQHDDESHQALEKNIVDEATVKAELLVKRSKLDVWSVGWLLYYMATGKHPPSDAWARRIAISQRDLRNVPPECREIIQMCVEHDVEKRSCMLDVKRRIDSILQGLMFGKGLGLLESERQTALVLLDKAVGIKSDKDSRGALSSMSTIAVIPGASVTKASAHALGQNTSGSQPGSGQQQHVLGLTVNTQMGLASLPLVVVRRVEWEAAARQLGRSRDEISRLRGALVNEKWNKGDVIDGAGAVEYLTKRSVEGVASAQSALGWVYRWGAGGVQKNVDKAMDEWGKAVSLGDPEACNGLGLLYHHGREDVCIDGEKARKYYQIAVDQGYPAAAVNLGVMLHDGAAGLAPDGVAARGLYEMACRHGDAIAANNLGLLLQHGAPGVEADAGGAVRAYEMAIARNERHHACRNLGELLWKGAEGVSRSRANAVEYFAHAIARGDTSSRRSACAKLKKLVRLAENEAEDTMPELLLERCHRLLSAMSM